MASSTVVVVPVQVKTQTPPWRIRQSVVTYVSLIPYVVFALYPVCLPGWVWNEFLYSLVFIQDELQKTLSVGVVRETHPRRHVFLGLTDGGMHHGLAV